VAELLQEFEFEIAQLTVIPSDGGRFELTINGELVFSKKALGRHAQPGEIKQLVQARIQSE
jgi:selenoprotein W-related protein